LLKDWRDCSLGIQCEGFTKFLEANKPSSLTVQNLIKQGKAQVSSNLKAKDLEAELEAKKTRF